MAIIILSISYMYTSPSEMNLSRTCFAEPLYCEVV